MAETELTGKSLQERYAPTHACFVCGPANPRGLHLRSFVRGDEVVAEWYADPYLEAYPGVVNAGIIGAVLDCHAGAAAAWYLMRRAEDQRPRLVITADYSVRLRRPTPSKATLELVARFVEATEERAVVEAELRAAGEVCARLRGTFVVLKPEYTAFRPW